MTATDRPTSFRSPSSSVHGVLLICAAVGGLVVGWFSGVLLMAGFMVGVLLGATGAGLCVAASKGKVPWALAVFVTALAAGMTVRWMLILGILLLVVLLG